MADPPNVKPTSSEESELVEGTDESTIKDVRSDIGDVAGGDSTAGVDREPPSNQGTPETADKVQFHPSDDVALTFPQRVSFDCVLLLSLVVLA